MELKVLLLLVCAGILALTIGGLLIYYSAKLTRYMRRTQEGEPPKFVAECLEISEVEDDTDVERRGQHNSAIPPPLRPTPPLNHRRYGRQPMPGPLDPVFCVEDIMNPPPQYRVPHAHITHWRPPRPRPVRRFIVARVQERKPIALRVPKRLASSASRLSTDNRDAYCRSWTPSSGDTTQEACDLLPLLSQYPPPPSPWGEHHPAAGSHVEHLNLLKRAEEYRRQRIPRRIPSSIYESE
ncbi:hypothetical protein HIM_05835 [Hirsutella minnesotensis 3608]|uniref:Uncharacterized protein n=1 Tax=Hirsutella minnesotensis 3608 TaxID=1043627 RepID=A0A0F7ZUE4_9HYPO|nr:hypothetical protein HIM_05835 [Hirsutella minnesotensis 3608]